VIAPFASASDAGITSPPATVASGRAAPRPTLTPSEERVARLAASGLTNRQIASALQISPKTVDSHLGRAYRKLAIRSRAGAGRADGGW
jgi:DNA-binding CsgD family transcriptional regulator